MEFGKFLHYLDDYLGGARTCDTFQELLNLAVHVLSLLNVPIADDKTEGPTTVLCFLGLELDSV